MTEIEEQARSIFLAALERAPDQWPAFLNEACAENVELRARASQLLYAHQAMGSIHGGSAAAPVATIDEPIREGEGSVIGPYKLLEQIGEGGFGVVFMAEQTEPVRRKVALKILKPGMDTRQVVARFEAERQALAIMDHPNIAKVFDGGMTGERRDVSPPVDLAPARAVDRRADAAPLAGRPYFVMELVKGVPITQFCDEQRLSPRQRLELFLPVCQAVQHAHQKGIIHRDLKPSNVLVSRHDATPIVKVIDFGVAKALGQELTDKTLFTGIAQMIGTPLYMSPEQAGMSDLDVDTRSDIYSLGVLLYELLTGTTPFTKERFKQAAYDEIRRIIREEEPPRPSTRLSDSKDSLPSISAQRQTEPGKLTKLVRGELDWIVMKCLEKDRIRRYESANGLAHDVERYLHDQPVQACPPSVTYRLGKFARRNKAALAVTGLIAAALVVAVVVLAVSNVRIARETQQKEEALEKAKTSESQARTEAQRAALVADLLQQALASANPEAGKGAKFTVRQLLDAFSDGLEDQVRGQPEVEASIRRTVGRAYWRLHELDTAQRHLARSLELLRGAAVAEPTLLAQALVDWAWVMSDEKNFGAAETALREAVGLYRTAAGPPRQSLEAFKVSMINEVRQGHHGEVERLAREAREVAQSLSITQDPNLASVLNVLSGSRRIQGKLADAELLARESVAMHRQTRPKNHPDIAFALTDLAAVLAAQGKHAEAADCNIEALVIFRKHYPDDEYYQSKNALDGLVKALRAQNKHAEADAARAESTKRFLTQLTRAPSDFQGWLARAEVLQSAQLWDMALQAYQEAAKLAATANGDQRLRFGNGLRGVARALQEQSRYADAVPVHRQAIALIEQVLADKAGAKDQVAAQLDLASGYAYLGVALWPLKRFDEAVECERKALALWEKVGQARATEEWSAREQWSTRERAYFSTILAEISAAADRPQDALDHARTGMRLHAELELRSEGQPDKATYTARAAHSRDVWLRILMSLGRADEAIAEDRKACDLNPRSALHIRRLADTEARLGRWADAANHLSRALELDGSDWLSWQARGVAQLFLNQPAKAVEDLTTCLSLHPNDALVWRIRAGAYSRLKQWDKAAADFSKALEINPKSADDQNDLAWLLATCPDVKHRNVRRAVELASRAVELVPKRGSFWNTLGVTRYYAGDHQGAIDALNESMELNNGGDGFDWIFLAMARRQLGDTTAARHWYDQAVAWMEKNAPKNDDLIRFRAEAAKVLELQQ
jgi:serine/threonine protein kinase/tetratricopeptide (TPR) repeat protein